LPFLLDILEKKRLTLSDPAWWEDKNDYGYLKLFKEKSKLKSVLVLCFANAPELYSHWKGYADSSSGVCIEFDEEKFLDYVAEEDGIKRGSVQYETFEHLKARHPKLDELPFIKRYGFIDDREFRVVYCNDVHTAQRKHIRISLECISRIIFGPRMPGEVALSVERVVRKIDGCEHIPMRKSTLTESRRWTRIAEELDLRI